MYTAQEVEEGITIKEEDKNKVTTDLGVDSDKRFDPDSESDFNDDVDGDENVDDKNI